MSARRATIGGRWWGARALALAALAISAFAMANPTAAHASPPVWTTTISASCTNVTAGNSGEAQGNLLGKTGKLLILDGVSAGFGQFCGTSQSVTTSKEPFSAAIQASATTGNGVPVCIFGSAVISVPGTATFSATTGCPFVGSLTLTIGQPARS